MGVARQALVKAVDKSLEVQGPAVDAYLTRARQRRPDASPSDVVASLEKQYLSSVVALGAGSGATAVLPGVTTPAAVAVNLAEVGAFIEASTLFALALARVHGIHVEDLERRRTLLFAILLGDAGSKVVQKVAGRTGPYWARSITRSVPMSSINAANKVLGPHFITKYGTKQGILVLGRDLPFGIGIGIGAGGNLLLGKTTVRAARRAFGPPPDSWMTNCPADPEAPSTVGTQSSDDED